MSFWVLDIGVLLLGIAAWATAVRMWTVFGELEAVLRQAKHTLRRLELLLANPHVQLSSQIEVRQEREPR